MSYLKNVLQPGEQVRHVTNIHWIIYLPGLVALAAAGATLIMALASDTTRELWQILAALLFVIALAMIFAAWFRRWTTEIAVTNRRIIYKRGFIRRHTIEMNMDKVASVDVVQSVFGRLFNYGNITIQAVGQNLEAIPTIEAPIEFRNNVTAR
jgi:uncharacterized membrane protein YdbT with pleckstrin-like domain